MNICTVIAAGTHATLWACPLNELDSEIAHMAALGHIVRTNDQQPVVQNWAWDCDCGVYIYGAMETIRKVWAHVADFMVKKLDDEWEDDLAGEDSPTNFVFVRSADGTAGLIVGGGYYEETEPKLLALLKAMEAEYGVTTGELGANYSDDGGIFDTILERMDNAFDEGRTEVLNPVERALLNAYFKREYGGVEDFEERYPRVAARNRE